MRNDDGRGAGWKLRAAWNRRDFIKAAAAAGALAGTGCGPGTQQSDDTGGYGDPATSPPPPPCRS